MEGLGEFLSNSSYMSALMEIVSDIFFLDYLTSDTFFLDYFNSPTGPGYPATSRFKALSDATISYRSTT